MRRDGALINLTPLEFDLLVALARKPWQVFSREVLLEQVWGYRHAGDTRLVNVHVQRLRSKIERDPEHPEIVVTVRGVGYKAGPGLSDEHAGSPSGGRFLPALRWRRSLQLRVVTGDDPARGHRGHQPGQLPATSGSPTGWSRTGSGPPGPRRPGPARRPRTTLNAIDHTDASGLNLAAYDIVQQLASVEDQRDVILLRERGRPGESTVSDLSTGRVTKAIPDNLRAAVVASPAPAAVAVRARCATRAQTRQDPGRGDRLRRPGPGGRAVRALLRLQPAARGGDGRPGPPHLRASAASCWSCWSAPSPTS